MLKTKNTKLNRRQNGMLALEQRFMFDGAAVDTIINADLADHGIAEKIATERNIFVPVAANLDPAIEKASKQTQEQIKQVLGQWSDSQWAEVFNLNLEDSDVLQTLRSLQESLQNGTYEVSVVSVDAAQMGFSMAAFAANGPGGKPTIFLNSAWWTGAENDPNLSKALLEEFGHSLDAFLNPNRDTKGDEGELFAAKILGVDLSSLELDRIQNQNDSGFLNFEGQTYEVEHASYNFTTAYRLAPESPRYEAEKEQESDRFLGQTLGVAKITDNTGLGTFSGNDVVVDLTIAGTTYHGWISRPIKDQGIVRGFYFWYDPSFTSFSLATADGNQDGDSNAADNQGFILVVDQSWFNSVTAKAPVYNNGSLATNVYEVGSSSDRVDSALNAIVTASNRAPSVVADTKTITEGTSTATGNVLTNDSDNDGNALTVVEFALNGQLYTAGSTANISGVGTLVINADGTYTFTPVVGFTGAVPVATYKVSDGITTANTTLSINVTPVNSSPDAINDTGTVTEDVALSGNLLTNDTDPDGDTLTVTGFSFTPSGGSLISGTVGANTVLPGVGSIIIYSNGSYTFTPAANYDGSVPVITYAISDGNGGTDTATLTLTMTPVADGPTLSNDTNATGSALAIEKSGSLNATVGQNATGNVLSNDSASSGSLTVTYIGKAGATMAVTASTNSSNGRSVVGNYGTLTIGSDGTYSYVVDDSNATVQALRVTGQTLTESFVYRAIDGSGISGTANLTVTIDGRNDNPVAVNDYNLAQETTTIAGSGFVFTGFSASGNVLTNDTDVDGSGTNGETKTITGFSINGSATFSSYTSPTVSSKLVFKGDSGFNSVNGGEELYILSGGTYYLAFNSAGTKIDVVSKTLVAGTTADYEITLSDTPAKYSTGTAGSYTAIPDLSFFSNKSVGFENSTSLTENTAGMKTATSSSGSQSGSVITLSAGYTGTIAEGMDVSGTGITAGTTVSKVTYTSGVITSVTLNKSFAVGALSGTLTFSSSGTLATSLTGQHGSLVLNGDGSYTYTPTTDNASLGAGETATESFAYTMKDASNVTSNATLYITVLGASSGAPSAVNDVNSLTEDTTSVSKTSLNGVLSNDTKDSGATVIRISSSTAADTTLDGSGDYEVAGLYGTLKIKADGSYVYTLNTSNAAVNAMHAGDTLTENFQYVINDASGGTYVGVDSANLTITINGVNDLPVGGKLPDGTADPAYDGTDNRYEITTPEDSPISGQVKAYDSDDTSLTYTAGSAPTNGSVLINSNGTYTYTPNGNYVGNDQFTVTVSDGRGGTATITVYITVTPVNDLPFLDLDGSTSGSGFSTAYTLGGAAVPIADTDRLITDIDDTNIESAVIVLTNAKTGDSFSIGTLPSGITANTSVAGQITLSGSASIANYQTALRAISFTTTGGDRTERSISVVVNDGDGNSNTAYTSINIRLAPLVVTGVTVNEASPFAVFKVEGASGQTVKLALNQTGTGTGDAVLGMDTTNAGTGKALQYLNGSNQWVDYTPGATVTMTSSTLLVRTAIRQDQPFEGLETYVLTATDDADVSVNGQGGIIDDGTGHVFLDGNITFTPSANTDTGYPVLDDDRKILVESFGPVNEASTYAMFTVSAEQGYVLNLSLQDATSGTAATRSGFTYEFSTDGINWQTYNASSNQPTVPASGKIYVRVDIRSEADTTFERAETFALKASYVSNTSRNSAADTSIVDDGTGTKYPGTITSNLPDQQVSNLDDDRTISVTAYGPVNEASTYAMFTVTGVEGYALDLNLQNATAGTAATYSGFTYQYSIDGQNWTTYTANQDQPTVPQSGKVYVRVNISSESDAPYEVSETFALKASYSANLAKNAAADTSIVDDGTGTKYGPNFDPTNGPATDVTNLDNDQNYVAPALTVSNVTVNEGSPYAVFTVSGVANQQATLALSGQNTDGSNLSALQYFNGTSWQNYTAGATVTLNSSGTLLVRVALSPEQEAALDGPETFNLVATNTSGSTASGLGTIVDDGTGSYFASNNNSDTSAVPSGTNLDDDRPLAVSSVTVNEGSPYAVFTVTGAANQLATLALSGQNSDGANLSALQYFDGTTWQNYTAGATVTLNSSGTILVRVALSPEQEAAVDGPETFNLVATNTGGTAASGVGTIVDDGTGSYFAENNNSGTSSVPSGVILDDDRALTVSSVTVNEGSPYAVFTVTGAASQKATLGLSGQNTDGSNLSALQYFDGTTWQNYTAGATVTLNSSGTILVRVALSPEQEAAVDGPETFNLVATNTGGTAASGVGTIVDDGTGSYFAENNNSNTSNVPSGITLDDDRVSNVVPALTVNSVTVNEGSPFAVFTVSGVANQQATLALSGQNTDGSNLSALQYFDGTTWQNYTAGATVTLNSSGTILVRVALSPEQEAALDGPETFNLVATNTGGSAASGVGTIVDDGTGSYFAENNNSGTSSVPAGVILDDDRALTVSSVTVNEGSPYAVFTVTGAANQKATLGLSGQNSDNADLSALQYFDGTTWQNYTAGATVTLNSSGTILVRVALSPEQEAALDGPETFNLVATNTGGSAASGVGTIVDDGTGSYFAENNNSNTSNVPSGTNLDDDRPLAVSSVTVNEGSPYAVFTVTGAANQLATLALSGQNSDGANLSALQYFDGTTWQNYTAGATVTLNSSGTILVRVALSPEQEAALDGPETFNLIATNTGGTAASGVGTIVDDGTGSYFAENNNSGTSSVPAGVILDDDRALTVSSVTVNEGSPYAVFTVTGAANQLATLALSGQNSDGANLSALQYFDGTTWQNYTAGATVTLNSSGTILVRVALSPEQEAALDGPETFNLVATNTGGTAASGVGTIVDDGTGSYFAENNNSGTSSVPAGVILDDDRALTVSSVTVNEGSPYAVFTVTGAANQLATLALSGQNSDGANLSALQYFDGTTWQNYTAGATVTLNSSGTILVRVALSPEQEAALDGPETFNLVATNTGGTAASGVGTIVDDGTGSYFAENNNSGTSSVPAGVILDDDRALTVSSVTVNEGSPYAVFTVTGAANQKATLGLSGQNSDGANLSALQYFDGTTWQNYTAGATVTLNSSGTILVRVALSPEQDDILDGPESFNLVAINTGGTSASGVGTIVDDGTGSYFAADNNTATPAVPAGVALDDDRPKPTPLIVKPVEAAPASQSNLTPPQIIIAPIVPAFSSALNPLRSSIVVAEPPQSLMDSVTSGSGYQIPVSETAPIGLTLYQGVTDQFVQSTNIATKVSLPFDAFIHSNKDAVIKLNAKQADDSPLPNWVQFDPTSGVFEVTPPAGFKGKLNLKVIARDDDGREATAIFQMFVGEQSTDRPQSRSSFTDKLKTVANRPLTLIQVSEMSGKLPAAEGKTLKVRVG